jgi:NADPH-dependent F420 reductase
MSISPYATVALIGGTGKLGSGLARRLAVARRVIIGSRDPERARAAAQALAVSLGLSGPAAPAGAGNREAAAQADLVVLAVPFSSHAQTLAEIKAGAQGKIVVDTTVPLRPPKVSAVQLPPEGSAAVIAQRLLGPDVRVVSAFQNVPAHLLQGDHDIDCDVLVCGDDADARKVVIELAATARLRGLHAGLLCNSAAAEALTSALIFINRQYGGHAGVRITGAG